MSSQVVKRVGRSHPPEAASALTIFPHLVGTPSPLELMASNAG
jgi:hypothetical protein